MQAEKLLRGEGMVVRCTLGTALKDCACAGWRFVHLHHVVKESDALCEHAVQVVGVPRQVGGQVHASMLVLPGSVVAGATSTWLVWCRC